MILENPSKKEAEEILAQARKLIREHNEQNTIEITSAMGYAYGNGQDILEVVKEADKNMYENKKMMKAQRQA